MDVSKLNGRTAVRPYGSQWVCRDRLLPVRCRGALISDGKNPVPTTNILFYFHRKNGRIAQSGRAARVDFVELDRALIPGLGRILQQRGNRRFNDDVLVGIVDSAE